MMMLTMIMILWCWQCWWYCWVGKRGCGCWGKEDVGDGGGDGDDVDDDDDNIETWVGKWGKCGSWGREGMGHCQDTNAQPMMMTMIMPKQWWKGNDDDNDYDDDENSKNAAAKYVFQELGGMKNIIFSQFSKKVLFSLRILSLEIWGWLLWPFKFTYAISRILALNPKIWEKRRNMADMHFNKAGNLDLMQIQIQSQIHEEKT